MRVVYRKTMTEQLFEAIAKAKKENREIEKFVLTASELERLERENCRELIRPRHHMVKFSTGTVFCGIQIEVEEDF
jgi:thiamine biosynthesis lipoprotein ApbE